jgi:hypothetical protein
MTFQVPETDEITWKRKLNDCALPVPLGLIHANRTGLDSVDVVSSLAFLEKNLVRCQRSLDT